MTRQRVLVTAAAAGIGRAIVESFRAAGALVAAGDADRDGVDRLRSEAPDLALGFALDVAEPAQCAAFVKAAVAELGGVDVLVNNAGVAGARASLAEIRPEDWRRSFAVNVDGAFYMIKSVAPLMRREGGGTIVNVSTSSVTTLPADRADYIASKWALEGLTRAAARELGPDGIRVNAIRPGFVDSDRMRGIIADKAAAEGLTTEAVERDLLRFISMRSKVTPREIGDMVVFLASDVAARVTGQLLAVDGGVEWEG